MAVRKLISLTVVVIGLAACSNKQAEIRTGYTVWDIPAHPPGDAKAVYASMKDGLESTGTKFTVSIDPPPAPLPEHPGHFAVGNPMRNSNFAAMMGPQGAEAFKMATCDGASFVATLSNDSMNRFGENTKFVACVFPYINGYSISVWHKFMMDNNNIGASLARNVVGDSSQFIPRTVEALVSGLKSAGFVPTVVESF